MDYIHYLREMVGTKPVIMVTAGVVIFSEAGELLLQHRSDGGGWGLIGGFMELGESLEAAARREVLEETGLTVGGLELRYFPLTALPEPLFAPNAPIFEAIRQRFSP